MVLCKDDNDEGLFSKSIRIWTKNIEGESDQFKGSLPPVGYPRNVTVNPSSDGLMVTWENPEYGMENLKMYIVRWSQGHDDYIFGSAETINNSMLSKSKFYFTDLFDI